VSNPRKASWKTAAAIILERAARVAICGVGNDLRGDDAAGILCLRSIKRRFPAAGSARKAFLFIDGGETPENQTARIREFRPDLVVLIDAARSGRRRGEIFVVAKEAIADEEVSTHRISLALLIRFIEESIGASVLFLGIEPGSTEPGVSVSAAVRRAARTVGEYFGRYF